MACASCGGGRQLTPNKQTPPVYVQSPNRIVVNPNSKSGGNKNVMRPNGQKTERTQV
jgi:hypothetical protein